MIRKYLEIVSCFWADPNPPLRTRVGYNLAFDSKICMRFLWADHPPLKTRVGYNLAFDPKICMRFLWADHPPLKTRVGYNLAFDPKIWMGYNIPFGFKFCSPPFTSSGRVGLVNELHERP
jgi:hypothetical protein